MREIIIADFAINQKPLAGSLIQIAKGHTLVDIIVKVYSHSQN